MEKARRRHVPAFGEWNYYYSSSPDEPELPRYGGAAVDWWYVPELDACSDVWFRYSPPPRKPAPMKTRRPAVATPAEKLRYDNGGKGARARASDRGAVARTPVKGGGGRRVVRPVDKDLYQVPPPDFTSGRPRRVRHHNCLVQSRYVTLHVHFLTEVSSCFVVQKRSLWRMGCFGGLNCVA
jgi:hypothetical protein